MMRKTFGAGIVGVLLLGLTGCSGGDTAEPAGTSAATATPAPSASASVAPTATPEAVAQLSDAELAGIFTDLQFIPDQFATTGELIGSIYPGLSTSDPTCLTPFGLGWDEDADLADATVEFGTSNDRSMTAVVSSVGAADVATGLVADSADTLERCGDGTGLFKMQGMEVQTSVEQFETDLTGTDEALGWRVTGDVGGSPFALVGITARVGGNVVALVGWDPAIAESYVPLAGQMLVDAL